VRAPLLPATRSPRDQQEGRVTHPGVQIIETAAGIGHRPTVQLGLHLLYPLLVPQHEELNVLGGGRATQQQDQTGTCRKIKYSSVRHEALLFRMEVRDLRCSAVVAVG
jgi:hypothetical protein